MKRKRGRPSKRPIKAEFELLYYNNHMTIREIAAYYNASIYTIYKWASDFRKEEGEML